jgi:hypothetical protein
VVQGDLSIADPVDFSILDSARQKILQLMNETAAHKVLPPNDQVRLDTLIAKETKKLDDTSVPN